MNPNLVRLRIRNAKPVFLPGETLECEYTMVEPDEPIHTVETSVIWYTEGKGDENLGVHFFDRRTRSQARDGDLQALYRFKTILPHSPLSYQGELIQIRWCIRVRVFWGRGKEANYDFPIQLGHAEIVNSATPASQRSAGIV